MADRCVADILDRQLSVRPDAPALWAEGQPVSYRVLAQLRAGAHAGPAGKIRKARLAQLAREQA